MKYGETFNRTLKDSITGNTFETPAVYRRATWHEYHTNSAGDGLWCGDKQIVGTCDFTVRGCSTEKAAKAKIRRYVTAEV